MFVLPVTLNSCFKCRHCFTKNNFWILNKLSSLCVLKVRRSDSENENRKKKKVMKNEPELLLFDMNENLLSLQLKKRTENEKSN